MGEDDNDLAKILNFKIFKVYRINSSVKTINGKSTNTSPLKEGKYYSIRDLLKLETKHLEEVVFEMQANQKRFCKKDSK